MWGVRSNPDNLSLSLSVESVLSEKIVRKHNELYIHVAILHDFYIFYEKFVLPTDGYNNDQINSLINAA